MLYSFLREGLSQAILYTPYGVAETLLFTIQLVILTVIVAVQRRQLTDLSGRKRLLLLAVVILSVTLGLSGDFTPDLLNLPADRLGLQDYLIPSLPIVLSLYAIVAIRFNHASSLLVGMGHGIGYALWNTHRPYDLFTAALVAYFIAYMLRQNRSGYIYKLMRIPLIATVLGVIFWTVLGFASIAVAIAAHGSRLDAIDSAFMFAQGTILFRLSEAIIAGTLVTVLLWQNIRFDKKDFLPSPRFLYRLERKLAVSYVLFATVGAIILAIFVYKDARDKAQSRYEKELLLVANYVEGSIDGFRETTFGLLDQAAEHLAADYDQQPDLQSQSYLSDKLRRSFDGLLVVGIDGKVIAGDPDGETSANLSASELMAIGSLLDDKKPRIVESKPNGINESSLTYMVAVEDHTSEPKALLGRILANRFVSDLPVTINAPLHVGTTIVDSQQNVVFQTNKLDLRLDFDAESTIEAFSKLDEVQPQGGISTLINSISGKPLVMRIFSPSDHPWKIGLSIPMSMVTISALETTGSYSMIWLFLTLLAVFILLTVGRAFSQPLTELETATQHLAIGKLDYPITTSRGGGFDGLGNAIRDIRSKLRKQQLRQLLLLNTSSTMAGTINIEQAIPRILLAVLRGTDATSARCIVSRKDGRIPLLFGEGPSTVAASKLDNQILELLKDQNQIILKSSVQVRDALDLTAFTHVPAAIFGIRLKLKAAYYGALWVEFDSDRQLDPDELIFIHSLSDQVLLLLENARLFSATESNRRQLAAVLANASDAVLVVDTKGRIRLINRAAEEYLAMPSADAIGQQSREVIRYQTLIDALGEPGGEPRYIEFSVENRDLAGMISILTNKRKQPIGKVVVLHDVSKLKAADKTKGDLLKIMSHDLRNPLASVRNYTELLRMTSDLPANQERWINGIDSGVHQIGRLLDDLSSAQRFDNDSEMGTGEIDISQLLHQIAVEALPQAESENTILTVSLSDDVPVVKGQSIFIRQAVLNLVDNAIKYAPGSETIDLSAVVQDDKVIISVSDQGPGIPKSELERIFEMFYQYSGYDNPPKLGTGLGLALVRSIVERHKGTVWCESTVGQGSTFKISLPIMS